MKDFLSPGQDVLVLHPNDPLSTVLNRLSTAPIPVLPVVDGDNRLLGVVNLDEAHLASQSPSLTPLIVAEDLMRNKIRPLTPDDTLDRALELFVENDLVVLPVVDDLQHCRVMGMVRRFETSGAYVRHLHAPREPEGDGNVRVWHA